MPDEPRMAASPAYAVGRLWRAVDSLAAAQDAADLARAESRIARWRAVVDGMTDGSLSPGSRTPVPGDPGVGHAGGGTWRVRDRLAGSRAAAGPG
jgi:hypothetical protein